jgi:hypothetical protein
MFTVFNSVLIELDGFAAVKATLQVAGRYNMAVDANLGAKSAA